MVGSQRRRRSRRPRYISLSRRLARSDSMTTVDCRQLDLFPLHPEPIHRDRDHEESYAARFLEPECEVTLNSILGSAVIDLDREVDAAERVLSRGRLAIGTALKGRERWEFCNEEEEEDDDDDEEEEWWDHAPRRALSLKLDYEEVLTAWSDKGPLYVHGEGVQVVPCHSSHLHHESTGVFVDVGGSGSSSNNNNSLWIVPESEEGGGGGREARVMRYREKRRSRLFAKKIRYEVRKINAEKRPRIKGRFVKREELKGADLSLEMLR